MEDAVSSSRSVPRGLLRVNAPMGFGRTVIAPLLSEFAKRHPHVEVQLDVTDRPVDLVESGRLRAVLPEHVPPDVDLFVYYPNKLNQSARARAFIDFPVERFGHHALR